MESYPSQKFSLLLEQAKGRGNTNFTLQTFLCQQLQGNQLVSDWLIPLLNDWLVAAWQSDWRTDELTTDHERVTDWLT